jgi:hypothetical protein
MKTILTQSTPTNLRLSKKSATLDEAAKVFRALQYFSNLELCQSHFNELAAHYYGREAHEKN